MMNGLQGELFVAPPPPSGYPHLPGVDLVAAAAAKAKAVAKATAKALGLAGSAQAEGALSESDRYYLGLSIQTVVDAGEPFTADDIWKVANGKWGVPFNKGIRARMQSWITSGAIWNTNLRITSSRSKSCHGQSLCVWAPRGVTLEAVKAWIAAKESGNAK